jgi:hypothetical protein
MNIQGNAPLNHSFHHQTPADLYVEADSYVWLLAHMGRVEKKAQEWDPRKHKPLLAFLHDYIAQESQKESKDWIKRQRALLWT